MRLKNTFLSAAMCAGVDGDVRVDGDATLSGIHEQRSRRPHCAAGSRAAPPLPNDRLHAAHRLCALAARHRRRRERCRWYCFRLSYALESCGTSNIIYLIRSGNTRKYSRKLCTLNYIFLIL